jgi:hypothetical protein
MANLTDNLTYHARQRIAYRNAYAEFVEKQQFTHALHLAWNCQANIHVARNDIRDLLRVVDRSLFGRQFFKVPHTARTMAMFWFEDGKDNNLHAHSLWRLENCSDRAERFSAMFPGHDGKIWKRIVPAGTYELQKINNIGTACQYARKEQHLSSDYYRSVWSCDFFPTARPGHADS